MLVDLNSETIIAPSEFGLTEDERYAVADHVVSQLKKRGDPWHLTEEAPGAERADY